MAKQSFEPPRIHIVYHGPGIAGKTMNLIDLHKNLKCGSKGEFQSEWVRETDRYIYFDIELQEAINKIVHVSQARVQCVPGAVYYAESRYEILLKADAIVFVADSQRERLEANQEALKQMVLILQQRGHSLEDFPWVLQYNKRDLPNLASIQELEICLNSVRVPSFEAIATQGIGVLETFQGIMNQTCLT